MYGAGHDFKSFYNSKTGRVARRVLQARLAEMWPDVKGQSFLGCGYALPFLRRYEKEAERVIALSPPVQSVHHWPRAEGGLLALSEEGALPLETSSVDKILLVHSLEFSENIRPYLAELWRVLKANGRLMIIVPSRMGLWSHADWSPFGHGTPYSLSQLSYYLRDNKFLHENSTGALYMPPWRLSLLMKSAGVLEMLGKSYLPLPAGVYMVEASKQLYAPIDRGTKAPARVKGMLMPRPAGFTRDSSY
jgi:SAM-dependent methyltransferase